MNRSDVEAARAEAVRFIERCDSLLADRTTRGRWDGGSWTHGPQTAAVKRSSLDLTRALAHMRRRA